MGIDAPLVEAVNTFLWPIRMPLFFAAAGMFAGSILARDWSDLLRQRVGMLLWVLAIWSLIRFILTATLIPNPLNPSEGTRASELILAFIEPQTGIWFLWSLAIFYPVTKLLRSIHPAVGAIVAVGLSLIGFSRFGGWHPALAYVYDSLSYGNSLKYFVFFYIASIYPGAIRQIGRGSATAGLLVSATAYLLLWRFKEQLAPLSPPGSFTLLVSIIGVIALLYASRLIVTLEVLRKALSFVGRNTLPIYVAQVPVISGLAYFAEALGAREAGPVEELLPVLMVAPVVVITIAVYSLALRFGAAWLYQLPSGRANQQRGFFTASKRVGLGAFLEKRRVRN